MTLLTATTLGMAAGLHGALYGAYKDSPHESFLTRRFVREIGIALTTSIALPLLYPDTLAQSGFVLYLSVFALTRLEALDPEQARIVELRYFAGMSIEETAGALGMSPATLKRRWALARAWLLRELGGAR